MRRQRTLVTALCLSMLSALPQAAADLPRFEITFDQRISNKPYTGRVFLIMTTSGSAEPRRTLGWGSPTPIFSQEVKNWRPGQTLLIEPDRTMGYPHALSELPAGHYRAQAAIDLNRWSHSVVNAPGNAYSPVAEFDHDGDATPMVRLTINQRIPTPEYQDTDTVKYIKLPSKLLSDFHGKDVYLNAAIGLPEAYQKNPDRKFPSLYKVSGFGGSMRSARFSVRTSAYAAAGLDIAVIYIDADCPTGHHVWADSANNGPWGQALTTELIPHLEEKYRLIPEVDARYVTGHSSGGWSSLWIQVAYPDIFGGCWSTSPDPVDFSSFQRVNVYDAKDNMYFEPDGSKRPVSRAGPGGMRLWSQEFSAMEEVMGRGGQLQSFEAVFSPRGPDGQPLKLWDRKTGKLNADVGKTWLKYDIRHIIETTWPTLGPKLEGKLHLFCGDKDTFYLELAFFKLRDALKKLGSDAYVEVVPGAGHGLPRSVFRKVNEQMAAHFKQRYPPSSTP